MLAYLSEHARAFTKRSWVEGTYVRLYRQENGIPLEVKLLRAMPASAEWLVEVEQIPTGCAELRAAASWGEAPRACFGGGRAAMGYRELVLTDGAIAYWPFDDPVGSTTARDIAGGHTGAVTADVTFGQAGPLNDGSAAALFDGDSGKVTVANGAWLRPSALTLEAWAYPTDAAGADHEIAGSLSSSGAGSAGFQISRRSDDTWMFTVGAMYALTSVRAGVVTINAWNHVVGTWDGAAVRLYVNGALVGAPVAAVLTLDTTIDFKIGVLSYTNGEYFAGFLKGLSYSPAALSLAQIQAHYALRNT